MNAVSATFLVPLGEERSLTRLSVRDTAQRSATDGAVERSIIWPHYFKTMGVPLLAGREFDSHDHATTAKVVIINESLARHYFGQRNPVGQSVWFGRDPAGPSATVVGVVRDTTQRDLREPLARLVYVPSQQTGHGWREPSLLIRTDGRSALDPAALRRALSRVNPEISVREVTTPAALVERGLQQERLVAKLTGFFGPLSLLLAAVGLYGLLSYDVTQRTREVGIRMALGAGASDVVRWILRRGVKLVGAGVIVGVVASVALGRFVRSYLYGVDVTDPFVLGVAVSVLCLTGWVACWLPARRAASVDPLVALRAD